MKKAGFLLIALIAVYGFIISGCVPKDPVHDIVIQDVQEGLQAEFSEDLAMIDNMIVFENMLKVYMMDDFPQERLIAFAKEVTRLFGTSMRENKKLDSTYHCNIYQKKMIDDKMKMKQIAECRMENITDRVTVKDLGLGSGKYDVK